MSTERRLERLERVYPPPACGRVEIVEVAGLPPDEAERQIREAQERAGPCPPGEISVIVVGATEPAPEGDAT